MRMKQFSDLDQRQLLGVVAHIPEVALFAWRTGP
jgi:hypothetical protein